MTTDAAAQAERLARLQARRSVPPAMPSRSQHRRSPALSAKVITIGASTTAMLGMIAGYGIADARQQNAPRLEASAQVAEPIQAPVQAIIEQPPVAAPPPQVIVVVVDGQTGQRIDLADVDPALIDSLPTETVQEAAPVPASPKTPASTPSPTATPVPVAVDIPTPTPAPAPVAAPAPVPEASSSGS